MISPYLSIVATSRNDNHGGNLVLRMQVFINALFAQSEQYKLPIELILVEWNPPQDAPLLASALSWPRQHPFCSVRIVQVPPEIHARFEHADSLPLYQMIGKNVGVRRARGEFILCTNIDIVFSKKLFAFLAERNLKPGISYRCDRCDANNKIEPDWNIDRILSYCQDNLIRINRREYSINCKTGDKHFVYPPGTTETSLGRPLLHTNGCGDFTLLSKDDWFRIRGYVEWDVFSFHLDSLFLYEAYYFGCREFLLDSEQVHYHIEHTEGWTPEIHKAGILEKHLTKKEIRRLSTADFQKIVGDMSIQNKPLNPNSESWGLSQLTLPETKVTCAQWESRPYLSIVVTTRNDDHGGNMQSRFQSFLEHLGQICDRHKLNTELIVVEWNPDPSKVRLQNILCWPSSEFVQTRIITVPTELHNRLENHDKFPLYQMIAKNVGIRKAKGDFILATNVDILFSEELTAFLSKRQLDPNAFYRIDRTDIGATSIPPHLSIDERLEFCQKSHIRTQGQYGTYAARQPPLNGDPQRLHTNACGDFTLMSREKWLTLKGYPEFHLWSIFIDGLLVHTAAAVGLKQIIIPPPCRIYHIEHDLGWAKTQDPIHVRPSLDYNKDYLPLCEKIRATRQPLPINDENWGLANMALDEITVNRTEKVAEMQNPKKTDPFIDRIFSHWIDVMATIDHRLYFRDQNPKSLNSLANLARETAPTLIVELGTLTGMSLRTWLHATDNIPIHAFDLSFNKLKETAQLFPVDFPRVIMHEQNILSADFRSLWNENDRVLFFVDAHDLHNVPIMNHVLTKVLPFLPSGSKVVIDDIWRVPSRLTHENAGSYFSNVLLREIDELQCFQGHYAPYHAGGSFMGFLEVIPLLEFVNQRQIDLQFEENGKHVWFDWDKVKQTSIQALPTTKSNSEWGFVDYNPLALSSTKPLTSQALNTVASLYKNGSINEAFTRLIELTQTEVTQETCIGLSICSARLGKLDEAYDFIRIAQKFNTPNALMDRLKVDLEKTLGLSDTTPSGSAGVTIFALPKPFMGHNGVIQRNALLSWTKLTPRPDIVLFGNETGVAEMAMEIGAIHIPDIATNEFGTPLVPDLFNKASSLAKTKVLAYVNSDIILMDDFMEGVSRVSSSHNSFLLVGQRWDLCITEPIDYSSPRWREELIQETNRNGILHYETGLDYFVHTKGFWTGMPPFALGRCAWDNWLMMQPVNKEKTVIDGTRFINAIHQEHGYGHVGGRESAFYGMEAKRNRAMAVYNDKNGYISGAKLMLSKEGSIVPRPAFPTGYNNPKAHLQRLKWLVTQANLLKPTGRYELISAKLEEAGSLIPIDLLNSIA